MKKRKKSLTGWTAKNWFEAKKDDRLKFGWKDWLSPTFRHKQKLIQMPETYKYANKYTPCWSHPVKVRLTIEEI